MKRFISIILFILLILLSSCKETGVGPTLSIINLIRNPNFELNGQPSLQYWSADFNNPKFIQDSPSFDGKWSLQLYSGYIPFETYVQTFITGESGTGVYKLTVWMKSINGWRGSASIGIWKQNNLIDRKYIYNSSQQWTPVSLIDTLSLQSTDTIAVRLSAGAAELSIGSDLFDDITFQRIW
ncbi:MAG: hypothetical protein M1480_11495 [Bacteroidetes bacterium]|nr:hypothetical protein [Bacteroidota bacterium]